MKFNFGFLATLTFFVSFASCSLTWGDQISDSSGWFVVVRRVAWKNYPASSWKFPAPNSVDASWWVNQMTNAFLGAADQPSFNNNNAGGGWEVYGIVLENNYHFGQIPRTLMTTILTRVLSDSNTSKSNSVDIVLTDANFVNILEFGVRPSAR
jgi:hypothetical protein